MDKVKEVVNKVIHPNEAKHADTTGTHSTTHTTHTTGTHTGHTGHGAGVGGTAGTAGPHSSNLANKADPRVDSDLDGSRNAGAAQYGAGAHNAGNTQNTGLTGQYDTAGPHSSNLANKADPRVDSDLDGSRNAGAATYGAGAHNTGNSYGNPGSGLTGSNTGSTNAGPHSSNLVNKVDPRVDSDLDGSRNAGAATYGAGAHNTGNSYGNTGAGLTGSNTGSTNAGPHSSNLANKLDPRVDSDNDGSRNAGAASYGAGAHNTSTGAGTGLTGGYSASTGGHGYNTGAQDTGLAGNNNYGSTTGSGLTGSHGTHDTHGTHGHYTGVGGINDGPAPNTAGSHKSDMLNKLDPRIDSDRDGSKTVGQAPAPQY